MTSSLLALVIFLPLFVFWTTAVLNGVTFPRLNHAGNSNEKHISVLIPARNEAQVIGDTITNLVRQQQVNFEIIVLDDGSTDDTTAVAHAAAGDFAAFSVIHGKPLPEGWLGKNWACQQLALAAQGDYLLFTDADVEWRPGALSALMHTQSRYNADMLTVWPTQITTTWAERLVVPLMTFAIWAYLPEIMVRASKLVAFAAANGQCLLFKRETYNAIGGHRAAKQNITEDVALARNTKRHGFRLVMADGFGMVACRMYQDWPSVRNGFGKNILAGHGGSVLFLLFSTLFHWTLFIVPWVWLLLAGLAGTNSTIPLLLGILGVLTRGWIAGMTRQRIIDAVLMPISVVLMTRIAFQALWWHYRFGGPKWKGRTIVTQKS